MELTKKIALMSCLLLVAGLVGCSTESGGEPTMPEAPAGGGMPEGVMEQGKAMGAAMRKSMEAAAEGIPTEE